MSTHRSNILSPFSPGNTVHRYDVFLSFRGEDVRDNFLEYLYRALRQKGILTFKDDVKLEFGERINNRLLEAIQESKFSIIVLSKNYADSSWCLGELVHILKCTRNNGQLVYPVFYHVKPSEIRKQKGAFGEAFAKVFGKEEELERWREALEEVGSLRGWEYPHDKFENEAKVIDDLVSEIFNKLINMYQLLDEEDLVGIRSRKMEVINLLDLGSDKNRVVGLLGMGGIGKTTLAKKVYDSISWQFEAYSFVENVREISDKDGVLALQEHLISDILGEKDFKVRSSMHGQSIIQNTLCRKKVLIVLDDVSKQKQVEEFLGKLSWFGNAHNGSRIIITTRDKHTLNVSGARIFNVKNLSKDEATQLFISKAFAENEEISEFPKLIGRALQYARGVPLALKVLGCTLSDCTISEWGSILDRLGESPDDELQKVLRISYDGLHWKDKEIFLDICCLFIGSKRDRAVKILESCGFNAVAGIPDLVKKSLLTISVDDRLYVHDLIKKLGWCIVDEESRKDPGKRTRLWRPHDVKHVLLKNTGTDKIEGIHWRYPENVELRYDTFAKMVNLRVLLIQSESCYIYNAPRARFLLWIPLILFQTGYICHIHFCFWILTFYITFHILDKLHYLRWVHKFQEAVQSISLPNTLRSLVWDKYPLRYIPAAFQPEHLVELQLTNGRIEHFWHKKMVLRNLAVIDLTGSTSLKYTPQFTGFPNLEDLVLEGCSALVNLHSSIKNLKKLKKLNLKDCSRLQTLPEGIESQCLEILILSGCLMLDNLFESFRDLKRLLYLDLDRTAITEVPQSIGDCTVLVHLSCNNCIKLECIPSSIGNLKELKRLLLRGCCSLIRVPEEVGLIGGLEVLDVANSQISELPNSIVRLRNLQDLSFNGCIEASSSTSRMLLIQFHCGSGYWKLTKLHLINCRLKYIPEFLLSSSLKGLYLVGNDFESLPVSIKYLTNLETLWILKCRSVQELPELPPNVTKVLAMDCDSLKTLCNSTVIKNAKTLWFIGCPKLVRNEEIKVLLGYEFLLIQIKKNEASERYYGGPGSKIPEWICYQSSGGSVKFHLPMQDMNTSNLLGITFSAAVETKHHSCMISVEITLGRRIFNLGRSWWFPSDSEDVIIEFYPIEFFTTEEFIQMNGTDLQVCFTRTNDHVEQPYYTTDHAWKPAPEVRECGVHLLYGEERLALSEY